MTAPTIGATPKKALDQRATSRHDNAVTLEMGEPGAAGRPLPQNAGRRGSLDDRVGEPPLSHEIPPGRRMRPNSLSLGRAFGDWPVRVISASCPVDWWEARRQSGEFAQALADVAEAQAWLEPLHQPEDVAFGVAGRIPPPASGMADDQDFAFASPVLQAEFSCSPSDPVSTSAGFAPAPSMYSRIGRPSIPPEKLLRAMLLQAFYSIRSERQLMIGWSSISCFAGSSASASTIRRGITRHFPRTAIGC